MVKRTTQANFVDQQVHIDAAYDFGLHLKINIHAEILPKSLGEFTAQQIQDAPIRLAISELQKLLPQAPDAQ